MKSPYKGKFRVSQVYKGVKHKGLDLVGENKIIYSTVRGEVEAARRDIHITGGMGLYVRIKQDGTGHRYYFAHLSKALVKAGQLVDVGDPIGIEGSTGHSTASHLHYEVRQTTSNLTFLDISEISGIPNALGIYGGDPVSMQMTVEEAKKIVKEKTGFEDRTIQYIADDYRYGDRVIVVLAEAMS